MKRRSWARRTLRYLPLLLALMFATEREARAYTDPGSGALIWQALLAGFVGLMYYFRRIANWIRNRGGTRR